MWRYAVDTPLLLETIQWLRALTQESKDSEAIAELSRLEYMRAQLEVNKQRRIELFQNCISITNQSLTINSNDVRGLFWKAAAIGKVAEDALPGRLRVHPRSHRRLRSLPLRVIEKEEKGLVLADRSA